MSRISNLIGKLSVDTIGKSIYFFYSITKPLVDSVKFPDIQAYVSAPVFATVRASRT